MTKEAAARMLRNTADCIESARASISLDHNELYEIADMLDPPEHPDPGTFVEFRFGSDLSKTWWSGIVSDNGRKPGVFDAEGELNPWDKIEYRRVYKIIPPPLNYWRAADVAWHCFEHVAWLSEEEEPPTEDARSGKHIATITREQMERRNGIVDDGEMGV